MQTFTRQECLSSLTANGCRKTGRNRWTDGQYNFRLFGRGDCVKVIAAKIHPARDANAAMREVLRPLFLAAQALKAVG